VLIIKEFEIVSAKPHVNSITGSSPTSKSSSRFGELSFTGSQRYTVIPNSLFIRLNSILKDYRFSSSCQLATLRTNFSIKKQCLVRENLLTLRL